MFFLSKILQQNDNVGFNRDIGKILKVIDFISNISLELELDDLLQQIVDQIVSELDYNAGAVFLIDKNQQNLRSLKVSSTPIINSVLKFLPDKLDRLTISLSSKDNLIVRSILEKKIIFGHREADFIYPVVSKKSADMMQRILGIKELAAFPLLSKDRKKPIGAIMLSTKKNVSLQNDISVLQSLALAVSVAITNAELYSEVQKQVVDLEQRNTQLEKINKLTNSLLNITTRQELVQECLDLIPSSFDVLGAVYFNIDVNTRVARFGSITKTKINKLLFKILPKEVKEYVVKYDSKDKKNLLNSQAIIKDKLQVTGDVTNVFSNIFPERVIGSVQDLLKIKSVIAIPVKERGTIVGMLDFLVTSKNPENLSSIDLEAMVLIARQLGMLLENLTLFRTLQETKEELAKSNKILTKKYQQERDMMGIMGHELRTPMTIAKSMQESVIKKLKAGDIDMGYLTHKAEKVYDSIRKEAELVETMLEASHLDNRKFNIQIMPTNLYDLADYSYVANKKIAKEKKIDFNIVKIKEDLPIIKTDTNKMQQIFNNLTSNAVKYTKDGKAEIVLDGDDKNAYVSFIDTGIGIPEEELKRIGAKFHRINQYINGNRNIVRSGGTGLGLYVVKGLVKILHCKMEIKSQIDKGSTFKLTIPYKTQFDDDWGDANKQNNIEFNEENGSGIESEDMFVKLGLKL